MALEQVTIKNRMGSQVVLIGMEQCNWGKLLLAYVIVSASFRVKIEIIKVHLCYFHVNMSL